MNSVIGLAKALILIGAVIVFAFFTGVVEGAPPTLPQVYLDTIYSAPEGNIIQVNAGQSLQAAIDAAAPGDIIVLQAGAVFNGPIRLTRKPGADWIYIRSSNYANLPGPMNRVRPSDAVNMPRILVSPGAAAAIETEARSHHYRFVGIEFAPAPGYFVFNLINIGNGESSAADLPRDIVFDRCYIHGDPSVGGRRGIAMNGTRVAVIDSYLSGFKEAGADSQAIWSGNSPGPLKIANNYLEGSGENVMFGGADPSIPNLVPSDIEIRGNHFFKPLSWIGTQWTVKNLLEFKNARRVLVEGNRFENNWVAAQSGFSVLITPRNQDGGAPWSATQDITIRRNLFVNLGQGINISGDDDIFPSQRTIRVAVRDNIITVTGLNGSAGRLFQIIRGPSDITIEHNTAFQTSAAVMAENNPRSDLFVFQNNLVTRGTSGIVGTGTAEGTATLNGHFTNWTFLKNVIIGANSSFYPTDNFFPADLAAVGFVDYANGNYRLAGPSPYRNAATDGADIGANVNSVNGATSCAATGQCNNSPLQIATATLPSAVVFRYYDQQVQVTGGSGIYVWSVSIGSLPPGLRLDAVTGAVRGRPRLRGTWSFTITAAESLNGSVAANRNFTIESRLHF